LSFIQRIRSAGDVGEDDANAEWACPACGLGIRSERRVKRVGIVDPRRTLHASVYELPEGAGPAVRDSSGTHADPRSPDSPSDVPLHGGSAIRRVSVGGLAPSARSEYHIEVARGRRRPCDRRRHLREPTRRIGRVRRGACGCAARTPGRADSSRRWCCRARLFVFVKDKRRVSVARDSA